MFIGLASLVFATVLALSTYQASSATAACQGVGFGFAHTSAPPVIRCMLVRQNKRLEENELNELAKRFADQIPDNEMSVRMNFIFDIFISRPRVYKDQFELTSFWIRVRYE